MAIIPYHGYLYHYFGTVPICTVPYATVSYRTVLYRTVRHSTVPYYSHIETSLRCYGTVKITVHKCRIIGPYVDYLHNAQGLYTNSRVRAYYDALMLRQSCQNALCRQLLGVPLGHSAQRMPVGLESG